MITKGVASVPSPVRNLKEWNSEIDHESFVQQVSKEFSHKYGVSDEIEVNYSQSSTWLEVQLTNR
jgi:lipoate-protein ligase A